MPLIEPLQRLVLEDSLKTLKKMAEVTKGLQKRTDQVEFYERWANSQAGLVFRLQDADEDVARSVVESFPAIMNDDVEEALNDQEEARAIVLDATEGLTEEVGEFHEKNSK